MVHDQFMYKMTSSNGNIFRVTELLSGNSPVTGGFPSQRPVTRSFEVFFDLRLNKSFSKQSKRRWFETLAASCHWQWHQRVLIIDNEQKRSKFLNPRCWPMREGVTSNVPSDWLSPCSKSCKIIPYYNPSEQMSFKSMSSIRSNNSLFCRLHVDGNYTLL